MISRDMRSYNFYQYEDMDGYGQPTLSQDYKGSIKMTVNIISQSTQDNPLYKDASYVGLTADADVNDSYVIQYGNERLKVLYINPKGRYKQVFMRLI